MDSNKKEDVLIRLLEEFMECSKHAHCAECKFNKYDCCTIDETINVLKDYL